VPEALIIAWTVIEDVVGVKKQLGFETLENGNQHNFTCPLKLCKNLLKIGARCE